MSSVIRSSLHHHSVSSVLRWNPSRAPVLRLTEAIISVIGVAWGFDSEELLVAAKPELLAKEPAEIVRWVLANEAAGHVSGHRRS